MTTTTPTHRDQLHAYLTTLAVHPSPEERLELRSRLPNGRMARRFYPADRPADLIEAILRLRPHRDVYVGCAPRIRDSGGRDAIRRAWVLWADCDTPAATQALDRFHPAPTVVIASGSPHARHAYWALTEPVGVVELEEANRRLAHTLNSDPHVYDAARILRPPGTRNHKHYPPVAVEAIDHRPERRYQLAELLDVCAPIPDTAAPATADAWLHTPRRAWQRDQDPVLAIPPHVYIPMLTGHAISRDGKVPCPLHEDDTPSLHAYTDHWYCFGCRRGGTVYDLAAALWQLNTRGPDFRTLRRRLTAKYTATENGRLKPPE